MGRKEVVSDACTHALLAPNARRPDTRPRDTTHTTTRMTTQITTPTDDDEYPTDQPAFDSRTRSPTGGAPIMFSPTSDATAGQFDTEADRPR